MANLYFLVLVEFVVYGKEIEVEKDTALFGEKDGFG